MREKTNDFAPERRPGFFGAVLNIVKAGHELVSELNNVLKPFGLTEPQYNVLTTLHTAENKPLCLNAIRAAMVQKDSNVSRIVDKLVERGLVSRTICTENRRKMDVLLTREGRKLFLVSVRAVRKMYSELSENISEQEAGEISRLLKKMIPDSNCNE